MKKIFLLIFLLLPIFALVILVKSQGLVETVYAQECIEQTYPSCDVSGCPGFNLPSQHTASVTRHCDANGNAYYTCTDIGLIPGSCGYIGTAPTATPTPPSSNIVNDGPGGCCVQGRNDPNQDCRTTGGYNEVCDIANGYCGTGSAGYSCRSLSGCALDSDCGPGNHCEGGTCTIGPPTGQCQSAESLQARFQLSSNDPWGVAKTAITGTTLNAAIFRNGEGVYAGAPVNCPDDCVAVQDTFIANITGPGTNRAIDVSRANLFTPTQVGNYTLRATCGNNITSNNALLTVIASGTTPTVAVTTPTTAITAPTPTSTSPASSPTITNTATPPPTPTLAPTSWTAFYRVSTAPFGVNNNPAWKVYSNVQGMLEDLDFGDVAIGTKLVVYAQFKSTTDQVIDVSKEIEYIGSNPEISSISCSYSPTGEGTEVKISGQNFGDQGTSSKVFFNTQEAQILSWGNQTATASAAMTSTIMAKIGDRLQENLAIPLFIITADGRRAPSAGQVYCTIKGTTVSFNTIPQCRPPQTFGNSNVRVQIYEKTDVIGVKPVYDQKITINADGTPTWVSPVLEVGKTYILVIRSPQGLGYQKEFTATVGSTVLQDLNLPVGDISPLANPDNVINSNDYSELTREWSIVSDVTRAGDFNLDKRVNSIDYSCMRNNFNQTGAKFLTGQ